LKNKTIRLIYPINIRFPMERANSIQIVNMCHALADQGVCVYLLVRKMNNLTDSEILDYYGLKPHKNLIIKKMRVINWDDHPFVWNKSYYVSVLVYMFFLFSTRRIDFVFLRDLGLARFFCVLKKILPFKVLYETHIISHIVAQHQHRLFPKTQDADENYIQSLRKKEQFVFNKSDKIFTITNILSDKIEEIFKIDERKISVLPDGVNTEVYKDNPDKKGIVYIGQMYPWKGVDTLIEAMQWVDSSLTVVGGLPFEDDLARLKAKAKRMGLDEKINFVGFVKPCEVPTYLSASKISVIPLSDNIIARDYTSPLKLFESMCAKSAVVASNLNAIKEIISDGVNGVLFEPGNSRSLASKLNMLLRNRILFDNIVENAHNDSKKFSWKNRAEIILKEIKKI